MRCQAFLVFMWLLLGVANLTAQQLNIRKKYGEWTSWLSHSQSRAVAVRGNQVVVGTTAGLLFIDPSTGSETPYTVVEGLNGVEPRRLYADPGTNLLAVGFANGQVDLNYPDGTWVSYPDIALTDNYPDKGINAFCSTPQRLYVATEFGIVVYDLELRETRATYTQFSSSIFEKEVLSVAVWNDSLWAGVGDGLYVASLSHPNLADGAAWTTVADFPVADVPTHLWATSQGLYALADSQVVIKRGGVWQPVLANGLPLQRGVYLEGTSDHAVVVQPDSIWRCSGISAQFLAAGNISKFADISSDGQVAGINAFGSGFILYHSGSLSYPLDDYQPPTNDIARIEYHDDVLFMNSAAYTLVKFGPTYNSNGLFRYLPAKERWENWPLGTNGLPSTIYSLCDVHQTSTDPDEFYISTWNAGICQVRDGQTVQVYNTTNSPLGGFTNGEVQIPDVVSDPQGNLWTGSRNASNTPLYVKTPESANWQASPNLGGQWLFTKILADKSGYLWLIRQEIGLTVYWPNFTPTVWNDDRYRTLQGNIGSGNMPSNRLNDLAEDQDGSIWIGTQKGVAVLFGGANALQSGTAGDAFWPIYNGRYLLEQEEVLSIAVDGANNKYYGTNGSGIFYFNPDGTEQLARYTMENSPLPSNVILDIEIDPLRGEVYVATDRGVVSFRGTATAGRESNADLQAFPNPADLRLDPYVTVLGSMTGSTARVTTASGQLVRQLQSQGGSVVWDGRDANGKWVAPGVYLVQVANPAGDQVGVGKVAIVNHP